MRLAWLRITPLLLAPLVAAARCTDGGEQDMTPACMGDYLGDEAAPMELELFALGEDLAVHELDACGPVDIVEPPQGGRVLFVGVRARNLDPCDAKLSGGLRDPSDDSIDGLDGRSIQLQPIAGRSGWGQVPAGGDTMNGFRYVANIPVCPNINSNGRDIAHHVGVVEIEVTDKRGKKGSIRQRVLPRCAQKDALKRAMCECLCQGNYEMDKCKDIMSFPDSPDAGACFSPSSDLGDGGGHDSDGGALDGAARD